MVSQFPNVQIKVLNDKNIKINLQKESDFKWLSAALNEKEYTWQSRPIKVMAKRLHHSVKPERINQEIKSRGYKLIEATPKLKCRIKQSLSMFMLSFRNDESIDKIYGITDILGIRVEIHPLRNSKRVPQCKMPRIRAHTNVLRHGTTLYQMYW